MWPCVLIRSTYVLMSTCEERPACESQSDDFCSHGGPVGARQTHGCKCNVLNKTCTGTKNRIMYLIKGKSI